MKKIVGVLATLVMVLGLSTGSRAESLEELQRQLDDLKGKVQELQQQKKPEAPPVDLAAIRKMLGGTTFSGYGELDYISRRDNGNGNGGNTLNPHRIVLNVSSELTDWIGFNTELEWENGGSDGQDGGVAVEQAYLNFRLSDALKIKTGVLLVPMGAVNQNHEPTNFYSSARPELDTYLIPSTWQEMGIGISGALHGAVDYQLMAVSGLDGTKFDGASGLREGRQAFGKDSNRNLAITGRLDIRPLDRLTTSLSFYTGNSAPSGSQSAYTTLLAFNGEYRISDFELSGEYVHVIQDNPAALNPEIGHAMDGYWVEGAWHVMPKSLKKGRLSAADTVLFARYSELNTQSGGAVNPLLTSGKFDRNYLTMGVSFRPIPAVAIKADYQIYNDHRSAGEKPLDNDKIQLTVGFVF